MAENRPVRTGNSRISVRKGHKRRQIDGSRDFGKKTPGLTRPKGRGPRMWMIIQARKGTKRNQMAE